eukprot:TRINITY_DN22273_c0_g1_i1.p1 TRINITY_DN22273_c0_g1~~TRINITY_DN22273_c0_g1_i1.p1  ORF type:complete len:580 (-),score=94.96 TRINITY_DN22273_c0_g1_i1:93-1832(-)
MHVVVVLAMVTVASADVAWCCADNGAAGCKATVPCAPGHQMCPPGAFGDHGSLRHAPQFHVRDNSCTLNDPNGPIYDPVHGVYHLHYQNHVGLHGGRTYGHAVSRDFAHWAHMPVSIWNDQVYDSRAIFTGSGTLVDGKVVQVYPGLCDPADEGCPGGTNLCIAVPADPSDPLQTNWTKTWTANPIVPNTERDPSTAWKTSSGEWRLTTFDTETFGSMDFKTWYRLGKTPGFAVGECPSFFPLPKTTPGARVSPSDPKPTHVHKASHGGDWMCVGTYTEGAAKSAGNFTATPGIKAGLSETKIDMGLFYASKDFYDPVKDRRINFGWARTAGPTNVQTMPREITWHPELQQLVYSPVDEQDMLREKEIGGFVGQLHANKAESLGLPTFVGKQSEVLVSFSRPKADAMLGVTVMQSHDSIAGTMFTVDYKAGTKQVKVGGGGVFDTLQLLDSDESIDMHIFVDNTFAEVYFQGGRVAMTVNTPASDEADIEVFSSLAGVSAKATSWSVASIWVTPEEVLRTPRPDGKPLDAWKDILASTQEGATIHYTFFLKVFWLLSSAILLLLGSAGFVSLLWKHCVV